MNKKELRSLFSNKRSQIARTKKAEFDLAIKENFFSLINTRLNCVHIYLPIREKNEINTWPIIRELWSRNISVAVPVMGEDERILRTCQLSENTELKENKWNIPEPADYLEIQLSKIEVIVIPLLAYDTFGHRVGYGKGHYDNYLKSSDKKFMKIGLSYFPPVDKITNTDLWDVKLDLCVTPEQVFRF